MHKNATSASSVKTYRDKPITKDVFRVLYPQRSVVVLTLVVLDLGLFLVSKTPLTHTHTTYFDDPIIPPLPLSLILLGR